MCALRAVRPGMAPNAGQVPAGATQIPNAQAPQNFQAQAPQNFQAPAVRGNNALADAANLQNLNVGILDNIDNLGVGGNWVTMDGTDFLYKALEEVVANVDIVVCYGKRFYQWVEETGEGKIFHDSDSKLNDLYKLKFEIKWLEDRGEEEPAEFIFSMPTASAMRFISYVKEIAKRGYGIGSVYTRMTISRQVQKGTTNRYSRAEFTMLGIVDADGNIQEVQNGYTTVGQK